MKMNLKCLFVFVMITGLFALLPIKTAFARMLLEEIKQRHDDVLSVDKEVDAFMKGYAKAQTIDNDSEKLTQEFELVHGLSYEARNIVSWEESTEDLFKGKPVNQKTYTGKDAYRASTSQIVLHYGEEMLAVDLLAKDFTERGCPAVALPGGPKGQVEMFIGRGKFGTYNQRDIDRGNLGGDAVIFYEYRILGITSPTIASFTK